VLLLPGEGDVVTDQPERSVVVKAEHELFDLTESRYEPGEPGPEPHVHREHADVFYVVEGELTFELGAEAKTVPAPAGTLVLVPAGVAHSFRNDGSATARFLNAHAPSKGFAQSLKGAAASWDTFDVPADGGRDVADAVVRGPGEGEQLETATSRILFKAGGADGDGTFTLAEETLAPGSPWPPRHRHERHVNSFYVLEGTMTAWVAGDELEAEPGSFGFVPPGVAHTFANRSDGVVRVLYLIAPGGFERCMKALWSSSPPGEPPTAEFVAALSAEFDIVPV
jgi:quercetin dioxygenase-like cupin family protein